MDWFENFVKTMSVMSVFLAGIWLLVPRGSVMRSFRFAIGLFTLTTIILSFTSIPIGNIGVDFSNTDKNQYITTANDLNEASLEYAICRLLDENFIRYRKVEIITDNSEAESIHITKAVAELVDKSDFQRAAETVFNQTGISLELGG